MSEHPPGTYLFAERIMALNVQQAQGAAKRYRLQKLARLGQGQRWHFYTAALIWLGQHLAAWGRRLQERYGTEGSTPMAQSA